MTARLPATSVALAVALTLSGVAWAQTPEQVDATKADPSKGETTKADPKKADPKKATTPKAPRTEIATFGGGCFWCSEAVFERIPGVKDVVSGYSGGLVPNPTYQMVCSGETGHAEVVQIEFDPDKVSFEDLLHVFWKTHDPTTVNAQGPDFGTQYRSIILFHGEEQKASAQKVYQEFKAKRYYRGPIVTELVPFVAFYPAEPYHQNYYRHHPYEDYSQAYIVPKVRKVRALLTPVPAAAKPATKKPASSKKDDE